MINATEQNTQSIVAMLEGIRKMRKADMERMKETQNEKKTEMDKFLKSSEADKNAMTYNKFGKFK